MATITERTGTIPTTTDRDIKDKDQTLVVDRVDAPVTRPAAGHRARGSLLATVALVLGVVAAGAVLTGSLLGPGVAVGIVAAFIGLGGMAASSKPHVAGRGDALIGMFLGLAAVAVGVLALTGTLSWLNSDTDLVGQFSGWLSARASWLFPSS